MSVKTLTIIILSLFLQLSSFPALAQAPQAEIEPNNSITTAQNLESASWSLEADSNISSSTTLPHVTIAGSGDSSFDYYVFRVAKGGSKGIFDIDSTTGGFDSYLTLYNNSGAVLASNDDSGVNQGAGGSKTSLDSYLEYTFPTSGLYVIRVGARIGGAFTVVPIPAGMSYRLQISVRDHSTGWKIYLPGILLNPPSSTPVPAPTAVPPTPVPPTPTPTTPADIACLFVLGQEQFVPQYRLPVVPGCSSGAASFSNIRYSGAGAVIGFTFTQPSQGYRAVITIRRRSDGRIVSYEGAISKSNRRIFTENIVNDYNSAGGVTGAEVTKTYANGRRYHLQITRYCPNTITPSGYKVLVGGQTKDVNCS